MKSLDKLEKPLAIAMWDSTWLRRRYRGGGFEDWDKALTELTNRGYNAVRIDAFPHLIAVGPDRKLIERFKDIPDHHPNFYGFGMWGSQWTNYINPREALPVFVKKCEKHGVKVALSTWFKPTADHRNEHLEGAESVIRIWDETLNFLEDEGCIDNIIYVDILNELPAGFCMQWYHNMLSALSYPPPAEGKRYNDRQRDFVKSFITESIEGLKKLWPQISIAGSLTTMAVDDYIDLSVMDFIDCHIWISHNKDFIEKTDYWNTIANHGNPDHLFKREKISGGGYAAPRYRIIPQDSNYDEINARLLDYWYSRKETWKEWLDSQIQNVAAAGKKQGVPVGNTEGYGLVLWAEHPLLDWAIIKEAAEIAAETGAQNKYLFNCSSNFCHPHHIGFWENVDWHKKITNIIKS
jgi:hypothetical protein